MTRNSDIKQAEKTSRGIVQDERAQDQPADKKTAQTTGKPTPKPAQPGQREQEDAAKTTPMNPGEPAGGE